MDQLGKIISELYSPQEIERITTELDAYARTLEKKAQLVSDNPYWYKFLNLYFIYPDAIPSKKGEYLTSLKDFLKHVKDINFNAVHILPFLESPSIDGGFDIQNYMKINDNLGSLHDMKDLMEEAKVNDMRLFMDLVFNHVSDQHEWFKKAEAGDEKYRNYFIHSKEKPHFLRRYRKDSAVWAEYLVNDKKVKLTIAFPDEKTEIPHWRLGKDGYWYYHTYYSSEIDVNWFNPDVFIEFSRILMYWASIGFNFRLDAIPFVGQKAYKRENGANVSTHVIIEALHFIATNINTGCAIIVETFEKISTIIKYFGTTNERQAHLSYDFHLSTQTWVTLIQKDNSYVWNTLDKLKNIPIHAVWVNFLRNHDELSLSYVDEDTIEELSKKLLNNGAPFREGYGISGRTYSLLGNDQRRFYMAYLLLASLPGATLMPYGDEIGMKNIPMSKLSVTQQKDTRNINRGLLTKQMLEGKKAQETQEVIANIFKCKNQLDQYLNVWPHPLPAAPDLFAAAYTQGSSEFLIYINLSEKPKAISVDSNLYREIIHVNSIHISEVEIELGAYAGIWLQK